MLCLDNKKSQNNCYAGFIYKNCNSLFRIMDALLYSAKVSFEEYKNGNILNKENTGAGPV